MVSKKGNCIFAVGMERSGGRFLLIELLISVCYLFYKHSENLAVEGTENRIGRERLRNIRGRGLVYLSGFPAKYLRMWTEFSSTFHIGTWLPVFYKSKWIRNMYNIYSAVILWRNH